VIYLAITARLYDRPEHYWISKTFSKCQFLALFLFCLDFYISNIYSSDCRSSSAG
jgi:hypothetical protein